MKRHLFKKVITIFFCCAFASQGFAMIYAVKRGDTLSEIAQKFLRGRIYGPKGSLQKLFNANTTIKDPSHIRAGDVIELPDDTLKNSAGIADSTDDSSQGINDDQKEDRNLYRDDSLEQERLFEMRKDPTSIERFETYSSFGLIPTLGFSRLDSTQNGNGSVTSDLGLGAMIDWTQVWSETLESQVYFNVLSYTFNSSTESTLIDRSGSMSEFGFGIEKKLTRRFKLLGRFGYRSSPYLRATAQNTLTVEDVQAGVIKVTPKYDVIKIADLNLEVNAPLEYEFSGTGPNITTDGGFGYGMGAELKHKTSWGEINAGGFYRNLSNSFGSTSTSTQEIRAYLGVRYNIGGDRND